MSTPTLDLTQELPQETLAKDQVIAFARETQGANKFFTFELPLGDDNYAKEYVQRMRTELSRFRAQLMAAGHKQRRFKMLVHEIKAREDSPTGRIITLERRDDLKRERVEDSIEDLFGRSN